MNKFAVINPDGTYAGVPCESLADAKELAAQKEDRWIAELNPIPIPLNKEGKIIPCFGCPYYDPDINQCLYPGNVAPCEEEDYDEEEDYEDMEERT